MTFAERREHPNWEKIRRSVEFKALKREMLILAVFLGGSSLLIVLSMIPLFAQPDAIGMMDPGTAMSIILIVTMLLGFTAYYVYRVADLFWHIDRYTFTRALMDKPHQGYKGSMYFTVEVLDRQGNRIKRDTRRIFGQWDPNFEEYLNKTALIGYNDETDTVVVIGLTGQ